MATEPTEAWMLPIDDFAPLREAADPVAVAVLLGLLEVLCSRLRDTNALLVPPDIDDALDDLAHVGAPAPRSRPAGISRPARPGWHRALRLLPLFSGLTADDAQSLTAVMSEWLLPAGTMVFEEDSRGTSCFITVRGAVDISIDGPWSGAPDHALMLRTALAFRLRTAINPQLMLPWLQRRVSAAWRSWSGVPGLVLHGSPHAPRVATVHLSCDTDHGRVPGSLLLTVLDDVFGVQAREVDGQPDRIAVDFSWIHSNTTSSYIVDAVAAVCRDGAALLDGYVPDGEAWRWPCTGTNTDLSLGDVVVRAGILEVHADRTIAGEDVLADQLRRGQAVLTGETSGTRHTA